MSEEGMASQLLEWYIDLFFFTALHQGALFFYLSPL